MWTFNSRHLRWTGCVWCGTEHAQEDGRIMLSRINAKCLWKMPSGNGLVHRGKEHTRLLPPGLNYQENHRGLELKGTLEIISLAHKYLLRICVVSGTALTLKKTSSEKLNNLCKVRQVVKAQISTEKLAFQFFMTTYRKRMFDRNELQSK